MGDCGSPRLEGPKMNFEDLTPEQLEKAKACKSVDELVALAKSEGIELTDEQLQGIAGGEDWSQCEMILQCSGVCLLHCPPKA